jgi:large subunit ribosomal protein L29
MDAGELRNFTPEELSARVKQWKDELFRSRFKAQTAEARDTSVVRKLRRDIARALTVIGEKNSGVVIAAKPVQENAEAVADKPAKKTAKKKKA